MARLLHIVLATFLMLTLTAAVALASNETSDTAQAVSAATPSVGGNLVGTPGGAFRYYRFSYPGSNAPVKIHLTWNPGYQITGPAFGFNVYGPSGLVGQGIRGDDAGAASTSNLTFTNPTPGDYLVQVYNYTNGSSQDYSLDFSGLGPAPAPVTGNATPDKAVVVQSQSSNLSGSLTGNSAGAYSYFTLDYPGAQWPMTISLAFSPAGSLKTDAFGFNVYRGDQLITSGYEVGRDGDTATKTATISDAIPGPYSLQIFNYASGVTGNFAVGTTGASGAIIQASGNSSGDRAVGLSAAQNGGHGTLAGDSAGTFAYYGFNYQGNNEPIGISLNYTPGYRITGTGVGFNVYRGTDLVASGGVGGGRTADEGVSWTGFSSDQAGYYAVQVFNYVPGVTADYTVRVMGLK